MANLELVVRCKDCGKDVDAWDLCSGADPEEVDEDGEPNEPDYATHVCEMAGDLNFDHECSGPPKLEPVTGPDPRD